MDYSKRRRPFSDSRLDEEKKLGIRKRTNIVEAFKKPKPSSIMLKNPLTSLPTQEVLSYQVPRDEPYGLPWLNISLSAKHYNMWVKRLTTSLMLHSS